MLDGGRARNGVAAPSHRSYSTVTYSSFPGIRAPVGAQPAPEDVRNWGRGRDDEGLRDWYADARPARHPLDVLLCQRSIITWARQDHATYADLLRWTAGIAFVATIVLGVVLGLSLGEYLLRLGLPALPACLDVLDIAKGNARVASTKTRLEQRANFLLERACTTGTLPTVVECRELQDGIFATRLLPGVPSWMYEITRGERQLNMEDAVAQQVSQLPAGLRLESPGSSRI